MNETNFFILVIGLFTSLIFVVYNPSIDSTQDWWVLWYGRKNRKHIRLLKK